MVDIVASEPKKIEWKESDNPHNKMRLVRDLAGKRIRLTYYHRDPSYGVTLGIKAGDQGPFDYNEVIEGSLIPVYCILSERNYIWGVQKDSGEIAATFLSPIDPADFVNVLAFSSQWDGKKNGSYVIEEIA